MQPLAAIFRSAVSRSAAVLAALVAASGAVPPETPHPGWTLVNLRTGGAATLRPMVTGLGFLSDGRLVVSHWGGSHDLIQQRQMNGAVYILDKVTGDAPAPAVTTYADKLEDPVGMLVKDDRVYVSGGEKLIELPDANKDGKAETARVIAQIPGTHARHEFLFGLAFKDGKFWMSPSSGKDVGGGLPSYGQSNPNRGTTMTVDPATGAWEIFAMGLREPNGIGAGPEGELFVPDVQGNWLPSNKLIHLKKGRFYGFKHLPAETWDNMTPSPPAVYLPQGDVSRAPGNPLLIPTGPYAGQLLLGDVVVGGIRRVFLEKVAGEFQGTVFFFSGGFEAGVNRLAWGPDGHLYVGMCGQGAGWSYKQDFGLQKMKPNNKAVFEMVAVRSRAGGMEIEYNDAIGAAAADKAKYTARSWYYTSTEAYGGPAIGTKALTVAAVQVSTDRKKVFLEIPGLEAGRVVYLSLAADIASQGGNAAWTRETWYTLNAISTSKPFETAVSVADGRATAADDAWARGIRVGVSGSRLGVTAPGAASEARIYDMRGHRVAAAGLRDGIEKAWDTGGWAAGVYTVQVAAGGRTARFRVAVP